MFDELEFKKAYQEAYDRITIDRSCVRRLAQGKYRRKAHFAVLKAVMKPAAATFAVLCLLLVMTLPVMAEKIPAVCDIVARYAPSLAGYILPEKLSSTSQGITMQVEAINVEDKTAEILVSFSDADDSTDLIRGKVDLYDSYNLRSYDSVSNIGGCSFLKYDEAEDKAYFKIDVTTFDEFDRAKLSFSVYQLLTNCSREERQVSLEDVVKDPATKNVTLVGVGGMPGTELYEKYISASEDGFQQKAVSVLDLQKADADMTGALTVTGIGYADGILRVQVCRGNFIEADRHVWLSLKAAGGEEHIPDLGVSWHEEAEGETLMFEEDWFLVEESELENLKLYGEFCITDGSVKGNWEVTFRVESSLEER